MRHFAPVTVLLPTEGRCFRRTNSDAELGCRLQLQSPFSEEKRRKEKRTRNYSRAACIPPVREEEKLVIRSPDVIRLVQFDAWPLPLERAKFFDMKPAVTANAGHMCHDVTDSCSGWNAFNDL